MGTSFAYFNRIDDNLQQMGYQPKTKHKYWDSLKKCASLLLTERIPSFSSLPYNIIAATQKEIEENMRALSNPIKGRENYLKSNIPGRFLYNSMDHKT